MFSRHRQKGSGLAADLHTHILPGMDDGSRDVEESLSMFEAMRGQGIRLVAATPHYINTDESIEEFVSRREKAFSRLAEAMGEGEDSIRVVLGAEMRFYAGMSCDSGIRKLCIGGTDKLLLEMPFGMWASSVINETYKLITMLGVTPIIAHVERYGMDGRNRGQIRELQEMGAIIQSNAEFFVSRRMRAFALAMLERGYIDVVASDCHNTGDRAPDLGDAADIIRGKLGTGMIEALNAYAWALIQE
jgi:protein-tyrosine phosphatase